MRVGRWQGKTQISLRENLTCTLLLAVDVQFIYVIEVRSMVRFHAG